MIDEYTERTKQLREDAKIRRSNTRTMEIQKKREFDRLVKELKRERRK